MQVYGRQHNIINSFIVILVLFL